MPKTKIVAELTLQGKVAITSATNAIREAAIEKGCSEVEAAMIAAEVLRSESAHAAEYLDSKVTKAIKLL